MTDNPTPVVPNLPSPAAPTELSLGEAKELDIGSAREFVSSDNEVFLKGLGFEPKQPEQPPASKTATVQSAEVKTVTALPTEAEAQPTAETAPPAPTEQPAEAAPQEAPAEPPPAEEPPKPPLTKFAIHDAEGELEPPELFFDFKAAGKQYEKVPLEKVVLLAQMGVANVDREQQVVAAKQYVQEAQAQVQEREALIQELRAHYDRLFSDPSYYEQSREEYHKQNSPERRLERTQQELQQQRQHQAQTQADMQRAMFTQNTLMPYASELLKQHPSVTTEAFLGRFTMLTAPLLVRGAVPPERLPEVERLVKGELTEWVKGQSTIKSLSETKAAQQKQISEQKRQIARAAAPSTVSAAPPAEAPKQTTFNSAREWLDKMLPFQELNS